MEKLEQIVARDISEWPAYAQVMYVQVEAIADQVAEIHGTLKGTKTNPVGLEEQVRDLIKRVVFLESLVKWVAGIGTAILTAIGVAATVAQTVWGRH